MAAEGIRFDNTFTCQPVCSPARAYLQTGFMSHNGYETANIGKWHLASTGGEPTLVSLPFFQKLMEFQQKYNTNE